MAQYLLPDIGGLSLEQQRFEMPEEPMPDVEDHIMADDDPDDSYDSDIALDGSSFTGSIRPRQYQGYIENGRRYQAHRDEEYFQPSDDPQWASQEAGHLAFLILDCQRQNPLFRAELSETARYVLDVGTGGAHFPIDVADRNPNLRVYGVDLFPPPHQWVPPNCVLEADDIQRPWAWKHKFDLIHMRHMLGSFSNEHWASLYRTAYKNCAPGGWIEQVENDIGWWTDDDSLLENNPLHHNRYRNMLLRCAERAGRPLDIYDHMQRRIEAAGFTNTHIQEYKMAIGTWPKHPIYKDAGRVAKVFVQSGMEGWVLFLLTHFGLPKPWSPEEVRVWVENVNSEVDKGHRIYLKVKRVWGQKPVVGT